MAATLEIFFDYVILHGHIHQYFIYIQGSHSSWKTWKNDNSFSSPGKVLEFYNFIKNPGKIGVNLEK